jgi:hypothetical protein
MREEIDEIAKANGLELPEFTFTPGLGVDVQITAYIASINSIAARRSNSWIFPFIIRDLQGRPIINQRTDVVA